jgi:hypothetical protein
VAFGIAISTMYCPALSILTVASFRRLLASVIGSDGNGLWPWGLCIQAPRLVELFGPY